MGFLANYFFGSGIRRDYKERVNFWREFSVNSRNSAVKPCMDIERFAFIWLGNYLPTLATSYFLFEAARSAEPKLLIGICGSELFRRFSRILYQREGRKEAVCRESVLHEELIWEKKMINHFKDEGVNSIEDAVVEAYYEKLEYQEGERWRER